MNFFRTFILTVIFIVSCSLVFGQQTATQPERSPEQEALRQTEKMQQDLNLTEEQARQIHEINLKYARERQVSNSRAEALQRIKKKEQDLRKVLDNEQIKTLQNKQFQRSTDSHPTIRHTINGQNNNATPALRSQPRTTVAPSNIKKPQNEGVRRASSPTQSGQQANPANQNRRSGEQNTNSSRPIINQRDRQTTNPNNRPANSQQNGSSHQERR